MSVQRQVSECRLLELLADRASFGLTRVEEDELRQIVKRFPEFDSESMEREAAMVHMAFLPVDPMPEAVGARIRDFGECYVSKAASGES